MDFSDLSRLIKDHLHGGHPATGSNLGRRASVPPQGVRVAARRLSDKVNQLRVLLPSDSRLRWRHMPGNRSDRASVH